MLPHEKQEVTGIVVNNKLQAPKVLRKRLRQEIYYIEKYGLSSHMEKKQIEKSHYIKYLLGIANFICFVNPIDAEARYYYEILKKYVDIGRN